MQHNILPGNDPVKNTLAKNGKRILFACVPADGHFNPLTGLATHLKELGYDVRFYTQDYYKEKIAKLGLHHYPFVNVPQINANNFEEFFAERKTITSQVKKFKYDLEHLFIGFGPKYFQDLEAIYQEFPYDLLIADIMFTGSAYIKDKLNIPVITVGIAPIMETSKDLAPAGLGITPSYNFAGKLKQGLMRFAGDKMMFSGLTKINNRIFRRYGVKVVPGNVLDILYRKVDLILQSGTPGFEYRRSDLNPKLRYIGPLLPKHKPGNTPFRLSTEQAQYKKVILVTQGTAEPNVEKLLVPTLEAFRNTEYLVIATTAGNRTEELKARFPEKNLLITDFIPFSEVMPLADVFITNGGYGGTLLGITHKLPLVVAGVHEGKSEICARVGYFKLGVNMKTETPTPVKIQAAVNEVLNNPLYKERVTRLSHEFSLYDADERCAMYVNDLLQQAKVEYKKINRASGVTL